MIKEYRSSLRFAAGVDGRLASRGFEHLSGGVRSPRRLAVISTFVTSLNLGPEQFFWLAQILIFLLGWPLEWTEITIIFMPLFLPLLAQFHAKYPEEHRHRRVLLSGSWRR